MELHPQPIAEAWGASFDGCVLKYSLNFRRLLGLGEPIEIVFDKTVPDAAFLLDIESCETHHLPAGLRLFLFRAKSGQSIGLFTGTAYSVGDILQFVDLYLSMPVTVVSKQEIRLWPDPQSYHYLHAADLGHYELPQQLVEERDGRLRVPMTTGHVFRLAQAPVYLMARPDYAYERFRLDLLGGGIL